MSTHLPMVEIKDAIKRSDFHKFEKYLDEVEYLPFELESEIITKKLDNFIIKLIEIGKLSNKSRLLLGSMFSPRIKSILKLDIL